MFFLTRRTLLASTFAAALPQPVLRLGILPFGSVQWVADTMVRHRLDQSHGFTLQTQRIANTEAAKVALLGHAVDVAVSDWPFVAAQRTHGGTLCFAAGSNGSLGGIMVPAASRIRTLPDLRGKRLGVAGGAADKSWLLVRAAARRQGVDLAHEATLSFGAPPLLDAMQRHGDLDALLTFWNFAARLEAAGFRQALSVADCARLLGVKQAPVLVGYVFDAVWARQNPALIGGFLAAASAVASLLAASPAEWDHVRPLMDAPDEALFQALRRRFLDGIAHPSGSEMLAQATQLQALLGPGTAPGVPPGVFWQGADGG